MRFVRTMTLVAATAALTATTHAGDLNPPPGPVAPTEAIILNQDNLGPVPRLLTQPGLYRLTSDLTGVGSRVLRVSADNVTIDLNGFTVSGGTNTITANAVSNLTIKNGNVLDPQTTAILVGAASGVRIENVNVRGGIANGIEANDAIIKNCHALGGNNGFFVNRSTVIDCHASDCNFTGFRGEQGSVFRGCVATNNTNGFFLTSASQVHDSSATNNTGTGVIANSSSVIGCTVSGSGGDGFSLRAASNARHCFASGNTGFAFYVENQSAAVDCTASNNTGPGSVGFYLAGGDVVLRDCIALVNTTNIEIQSVGGVIAGNTSLAATNGAGDNYDIVNAANDIATITRADTSTNANDNIAP